MGWIILGIRLCFHDHAPKQAAVALAFHQPATHQVWSNDLCWAAEESVGKGGEILSDGEDRDGRSQNTSLTLTRRQNQTRTELRKLKNPPEHKQLLSLCIK